jgi:hypothetical protein
LFDLWSGHLNTRDLFDQVFTEAREASQVIVGWNTRRLGDLSARLAVIATGFLILSPILASLDYNFQMERWAAILLIGFAVLLVIVRKSRKLSNAIDNLAGLARVSDDRTKRSAVGTSRWVSWWPYALAPVMLLSGLGLLWWNFAGGKVSQPPDSKPHPEYRLMPRADDEAPAPNP